MNSSTNIAARRTAAMGVDIRRLVVAALCLALCMVLPLLTGQIPQIGQMLSPMHIPVLICGLLCGWGYGAGVGVIAPLLRYVIFGMPPIYPTGLAMALELAAYGAVSGLLYMVLERRGVKNMLAIYISLIVAMLAGRAVWGAARVVMAGLSQSEFTWAAFLSGAFTSAVPGIICHLIVVPLVVLALQRAGLFRRK